MKKTPLIFILLIGCAISCGRKAPPLPPVVKIPSPITNGEVKQSGYKILLSWENPAHYSDGSPLAALKEIYLYFLKEKKEKAATINEEEFLNKAHLIKIPKSQFPLYSFHTAFQYSYPLEKEDMDSVKIIFAIEVRDVKNKSSALSPLLSIEPGPSPQPPFNITSTLFEDKILLHWEVPPKPEQGPEVPIEGYRVYRWPEEEKIPQPLHSSLLKETTFEDTSFTFDHTYLYLVRSVANSSPPFRESEDSKVIEITPHDTFPPQKPQGLVLLPQENSITLIWEPNSEKDIKSYQVWKKTEGEEGFTLLTPSPFLNTSYKDSEVKENVTYFYYVKAIDTYNNESEPSEIKQAKIQKD